MAIRAIVVDDEPLARARLRRLLSSQGVDVVADGSNGVEAVELVQIHNVDMLFIDINMPLKSGIQAAEDIVALLEKPPAIVFCTAYDQYAIDAFKTNATAYLLKPIQVEDIANAIEKATSISRLQLNQLMAQQSPIKSLAVHYQGGLKNIELTKFAYFCSIDKSVFAVLQGGEQILIDKTLKVLEAEYLADLVRVHRSTLINRHQVDRLVRDQDGKVSIVLKGSDKALSVSRRHLSEVKKCFQ